MLVDQFDHEVDPECSGEALKHRQRWCSSACFEARYGGLGHLGGFGELTLAPASLLAECADLAAKFEGEARVFVRFSCAWFRQSARANILPSLPFAHVSFPSSTAWASAAQRLMASSARWSSARSLIRVLVKTVSMTIRLWVAIQ